MKIKEQLREFKQKTEKELLEILNQSYEELRRLRFQLRLGELKDVSAIKKQKRKIARILTVLREKINLQEAGGKDEKKTSR
jgi:ribosomal protein L29